MLFFFLIEFNWCHSFHWMLQLLFAFSEVNGRTLSSVVYQIAHEKDASTIKKYLSPTPFIEDKHSVGILIVFDSLLKIYFSSNGPRRIKWMHSDNQYIRFQCAVIADFRRVSRRCVPIALISVCWTVESTKRFTKNGKLQDEFRSCLFLCFTL